VPDAYAPVRQLAGLRLTYRPSRLGVLTYAATQFVLLGWWVAFYPGLFSYDSVMYVWQATTGNWSTDHSVLYNGLLWGSLQITGQVALLTFAQTVAMAAGLSYVVTGLHRLGGIRGRWLALAAALAVCLPAIGTFTVYVSQDTAFVLCEVFVLGTVARLIRGHLISLLWTFFAELALLSLFRPNGFLVIALTILGVVIPLRRQGWRLLLCGLAAIAVGAVTTLALLPAVGVQRAGSELVLGPAYADLAVAYREHPSSFHPSDKALLATVAPLSYWRHTANCYTADDTVTYGNPQFSIDAARAHQHQLFDLWLRVAERAPDVILEARICRGSIAWNPFPGPPQGWTRRIPITGTANFFDFPRARIAQSPYESAILSAPLNHTAHKVAVFARTASDAGAFEWIAWRGATWSYVAYLAVALYAWRRRHPAALALIAVVAATQITVAVNTPSQLVRYMAGPLVLGILLLPLAFARRVSPHRTVTVHDAQVGGS
jgi:hypothetical protein